MTQSILLMDATASRQFNTWRDRLGERPVKMALFDMSAAEIAEELFTEAMAIASPHVGTLGTPETLRCIEAELNEFLDYQVKIGRIKYSSEFLYRFEVSLVGHKLNITLTSCDEVMPPPGYIEWLKSELAKYNSL